MGPSHSLTGAAAGIRNSEFQLRVAATLQRDKNPVPAGSSHVLRQSEKEKPTDREGKWRQRDIQVFYHTAETVVSGHSWGFATVAVLAWLEPLLCLHYVIAQELITDLEGFSPQDLHYSQASIVAAKQSNANTFLVPLRKISFLLSGSFLGFLSASGRNVKFEILQCF